MTEARTYRFPARDRSGWLLGLQAGQCVILGGALVVAALLVNLRVPAPVILVVAGLAGVAAFVPVGGRPGYTWAPIAVGWVLGRRHATWTAPVPRFRPGVSDGGQPRWPPFLRGVEIRGCDGWRPGTEMAVLADVKAGTTTGWLRVTGREFALIDRVEQERLLAGWGDALAGFCKERSPVTAVGWFEWAAPADPSAHLRWTRDRIGPGADPAVVDAYLDMAGAAGPMSTRHDTIVTVTVAGGSSGWLPGARRWDPTAPDTVRDELRLLADRLDASGLVVDPPVTEPEVVEVLRTRLDPHGTPIDRGRTPTLGDLAGFRRVCHAGPMATRNNWRHVVVDGSVHASFAVVEWPRLDVPANWMEPLLLHADGVRTVVMHLAPVAPSRSHRRVDKDSTRLVVDAEQRNRSGFRIGARHRRAESDVAAREAELVAGYGELEFCGLVTVTAPNPDSLERSCAEWEQIAAQAGLYIRRLDAQHDRALACALPVGIVPSSRTVE